MKGFFSRLHDTQTGHSKSASRDTYKFWIPNADPDRDSSKPNRAHENVAPPQTTRPHPEKRSSSRAAKHSHSIPVPPFDKPIPPTNTTATIPATQHPTHTTANHVPPLQHPSAYTQPLSKATSTRNYEYNDDKPQPPPSSAARPSYSTRTWTQQQIPTKNAPHSSSSRNQPTFVQHEVWLPTNLPSTSKQAEELSKVHERIDPLERYRSYNDEKDRPQENTKRERERERTKERERDRRRERDGEREKARQLAKEHEQENMREKERTRARDRDRERELAKDAEREQERLKEREYREREREREMERQREKERERESAREKEREQRERERELEKEREQRERERELEKEREQREREREKEREREREREQRDKDREREKYREREREKERARYYGRDREKYRTRERDHDREKDRGKEGDMTRGSPNTKTKDRVADEGPAAREDPNRVAQPERLRTDVHNQDVDSRKEKDGRIAKDPYRSKRQDGEHKYRAEATDGEQELKRTKPRTSERDRQKEYHQGWVSDNFTGHERKTSRQILHREPAQIDEGESSDNSVQVRVGNRTRQRHGRLDEDEPLVKNRLPVPLNTTTLLGSSNQTQSKVSQGFPESQPPISATPLQMPVYLPPKDLKATDRPSQSLGNELPTSDTAVPMRREINRLKLTSRQDDPQSELPESLPKTIDPSSSQRRPPSRASASVAPQYPSNSRSVGSQPLRSGLGSIQTLIGLNQKIVQQPSIASRSMTNMISEPSKDIELAQARQERKKEQYLLAAEFTPKVDPILSTSDKNGMQSVPSNPAVISSLQSVSSSKQPQLTPSVVNHTISRIDSSSKRLDHSPKSRQNTHASALLTAMDYSSEGVKQIPLAQVKETAEKTSHSMDAKHEHGTPSSLPPPPSTLMANRYPNLGRKESSSLPPPLAANIHPGQPSEESLDDTRPVSRAQHAVPLAESQPSRSAQASVSSQPYSGLYIQHLPASSSQKDSLRQNSAAYVREPVPIVPPSPSHDNRLNIPSNTATNVQDVSVALGQNRAETFVPNSDLKPSVPSFNRVGLHSLDTQSGIPQANVQEKSGTLIPQPPTRLGSGTENAKPAKQHAFSTSNTNLPSGDPQNSTLIQPTVNRLRHEASVVYSSLNPVNPPSYTSLRVTPSDSQSKVQESVAQMTSQSDFFRPLENLAVKPESTRPTRDYAPPITTPTTLQQDSLQDSVVQPSIPGQLAELLGQKSGLNSFDHFSPHARLVPPAIQAKGPEPIIKERVGLTISRPSTSNGTKIDTSNSWQYATVNPNTAVGPHTPLGVQFSNSSPSGRIDTPTEHMSRNLRIHYPDNILADVAVPKNESYAPIGNVPSMPYTISQNAALGQRRESGGLSLRPENLVDTLLALGGLSSPPSTNFKKDSPRNRVDMIHATSSFSKEASNVQVIAPSVSKGGSPGAMQREALPLQSALPVNENAVYGPSAGPKQESPRVQRENRQTISPKATSAMNAESALPSVGHPTFKHEPSDTRIDNQTSHVFPTFPILKESASEPKVQQTSTPDPAVSVGLSTKVLYPKPLDAPSGQTLLSPLSFKSGNVSTSNTTPNHVANVRQEPSMQVEKPQGSPVRRLDHKGVLDEDEEDRIGSRPTEYRQNSIANTGSNLPLIPVQKRGIAGTFADNETPSLGFFTSNFSYALDASNEQKPVEERPHMKPDINVGTKAVLGLSTFYGAGKPKTDAEPSQDLRVVSGHKNVVTGENRHEPSQHSQSTGPPGRREPESNRSQNIPSVPTYKISHPVLAEILSSPPPTKHIPIVHIGTVIPSTDMDTNRPSASAVDPEQLKPNHPISEGQQLNVDTTRNQAAPKNSYASHPRYAPDADQEPSQDASTQEYKNTPTSKPSNVQLLRPVPQARDTHPSVQINAISSQNRVPSSSNQPFAAVHPSLLRQDDLPTATPSPRPDGARTGMNTIQMSLIQDRKLSTPFVSVTSTQKENRWISSEEHAAYKNLSQGFVDPRVPVSSHIPAPPMHAVSHQPNRHQHSTSLPTSFPLASMTTLPQKDEPSRTRSPVYHQSHYAPFQGNLVHVSPTAEKTTVTLPKAPSEETILMTPSSLANSTMLKPTASRQSVTPSLSSQTAKKGGIFNMFRKVPPQPSTQTPQQYEIWHPNVATKTPDSSPGNHKPVNANVGSQATDLTPLKLQTTDQFSIPVPIHSGDQQKTSNSHVFTPFRYLASRRNRAISVASMEAQDGTAANTVVGSPTASMHSQGAIIPPPVRDPWLATAEWRNKEEADAEVRAKNRLRRQRPGVVFDVDEELAEESQKRPRRKGTRHRRLSKEAEPPPTQT